MAMDAPRPSVAAALCAEQLRRVHIHDPALLPALLGHLRQWLLWKPTSFRLLVVLEELATCTMLGPKYREHATWAQRLLDLPNTWSPETSAVHREQELDALDGFRFSDLGILPLQAQRAVDFHVWTDVIQAGIPQHAPAHFAGLAAFANEALRDLTPDQLLNTQLHNTLEWAQFSRTLRPQ